MPKTSTLLASLTSVAFAFGLAACHRNDQPQSAPVAAAPAAPASPAAAKVNGAEITVQQVENVLAKATGVTADNAGRAKAEILDKLIDQQLAVEQALAKKLDSTPAVVQALEAAKRDVLARAYLEQLATSQPKPTEEEAKKFYQEHPELFAQRRIYNLQEIAVPGAGAVADEVKQIVAKAKSMQDVANALKAKKIPFQANAGTNIAEQIPLNVLQKLYTMKDGETTIIEGPQGLLITRLASSKPQPVDEATALPKIMQFLAGQRNVEAIAKDIRALREKAKIEKLGEFASQSSAPAGAPSPAPAPAAEAAKDPAAK